MRTILLAILLVLALSTTSWAACARQEDGSVICKPDQNCIVCMGVLVCS